MAKKKAAKKKAPKKQSLRIYLLRTTVTKYEDAIRDDVSVSGYDLKSALGITGRFYLRNSVPVPVDWFDFVQSGVDQQLPKIKSTPNAAVLFIEVKKRIIAIVFGTGRYILKDSAYEPDFGLISTLNVVDPRTLQSLDVHSLQEMVVHKRIQTSRRTNLAAFDIDVTRERFQAVTGMAKDEELGGRVTDRESG
jgi:uncharacterized protein (TIGR04141 family)